VTPGGPVPRPCCTDLRSCLTRPPETVAPLLLGATLTSTLHRGSVTIRITEVEAYGGVGQDPGSHAHRRRTDRNATMFGPPGLAYVYFTYGKDLQCSGTFSWTASQGPCSRRARM
jgi:3-methyladenine DNA glycosylase Mpg